MDIQITSFILGMYTVLMVALVSGSVYAIVKVIKLRRELEETHMAFNNEIERVTKDREDEMASVYGLIDNTTKSIDSRYDKLYEKIMKYQTPKNRVFEMADKDGFKSGILQVLNKENEGNDLKDRILQLINNNK